MGQRSKLEDRQCLPRGLGKITDGTPVRALRNAGPVKAVAVGALPDGTPVIVTGGGDRTVWVWRLADGTPVGEPLAGHTGPVEAVAVGALPDGTPVIVSYSEWIGSSWEDSPGEWDATVRVWRLADGTPLVPPLDLPESIQALAVHGHIIVTAAGADIAGLAPGGQAEAERADLRLEACGVQLLGLPVTGLWCGHDFSSSRAAHRLQQVSTRHGRSSSTRPQPGNIRGWGQSLMMRS